MAAPASATVREPQDAARAVNGPEGSITDMLVPAVVPTSGAAPHLVATATGHVAYFSLAP